MCPSYNNSLEEWFPRFNVKTRIFSNCFCLKCFDCCFSSEFRQYSCRMEQPKYVIGIDGGGTKTAAVVCDLEGSIHAEAHAGTSNALNIGFENAAQTILDLIEECRHTIGCSISQFGSHRRRPCRDGTRVQIGWYGIHVEKMAAARGWDTANLSIETDARIALEGAFGGKPGIVIIAGTGSLIVAKDARGIIHRAGGWGRIIGDGGSGYSIGRDGITSGCTGNRWNGAENCNDQTSCKEFCSRFPGIDY